ncbi:hypothetical protein PENARI_c001G03860 [Penicillium arizonense]|uniref:NACHT domain-containing protein n=1 Tax=Penicillium arizonense TaxID=1835702 RepID=A0A1F5LY21_PENAI|nr:hypothetical protein PENARI_c001G03860 [Penicillium arizonense]OGE58067.1 hypothetical protein PENARI_c001G03860 [Penicillium arizonense]
MDPLSVVESITGIATTAYQLIGYLSTVVAGGKERLSLLQELTTLWITIAVLKAQLAPEGTVVNKEDFPSGLVEIFKTDGLLKELENLVQEVERMLTPRSTPKKIRQTLAWPLSKKDVIQTIEHIQCLQQTLHFALDQVNYNLTKEIRRDGQAMKTVMDETRLKEMIDWISPLNFITKQSMIFKEQHEGTCKWFFEHDSFIEWKETGNAILFYKGIPGAGKTFLSSIVINELDRLRLAENSGVENSAILMLYCKWDDAHSQSVDGLLASLLKQIAQRYGTVSRNMDDLFSKHSRADTNPSREEYMSTLKAELERFPKTFIVVDGLDELREQKSRLELLETLTSIEASVNIMVTSRPLVDIVQQFENKARKIRCGKCKQADTRYRFQCVDCTEDLHESFDLCTSCYEQGERCGSNGHIFAKKFNSIFIDIEAVKEDLMIYVQHYIF